jgi:hypothetical protein
MKRLAAAIVIGAGLLAAPASAQEGGGIIGLLGLGSGEEKDAIEYLERPPLVVPKSRELPPPAQFDAKKAAWPRDPDELAKKRRARERAQALLPANNPEENINFIRKEKAKRDKKIAQGRTQQGGVECSLFGCTEPDRPKQGVQPEYVDPVLSNGEPRRQYLTDPPTGLRARVAIG